MAQLPAEAQAATEAIERQTLRAALDASSIDELEYLKAIKDAPPTGAEIDRKAMRKAIANNYKDLRNWPANQTLDERQIVAVFDKKHRLCAAGWPHGSHTYLMERFANNKVIVHRQAGSIVSGLWNIVQVCREMNGEDAWRQEPGMSLPAVLMLCGSKGPPTNLKLFPDRTIVHDDGEKRDEGGPSGVQ